MLKRPSYQPPPAPFGPGDRVKFNGRTYTVIASTHTHTQLEGLRWAVANWELRRVKKATPTQIPSAHLSKG